MAFRRGHLTSQRRGQDEYKRYNSHKANAHTAPFGRARRFGVGEAISACPSVSPLRGAPPPTTRKMPLIPLLFPRGQRFRRSLGHATPLPMVAAYAFELGGAVYWVGDVLSVFFPCQWRLLPASHSPGSALASAVLVRAG